MATPYENERARMENDARLAREEARRIEGFERQWQRDRQSERDAYAARESERKSKFLEGYNTSSGTASNFGTSGGRSGGRGATHKGGSGFLPGAVVLIGVAIFIANGKSDESKYTIIPQTSNQIGGGESVKDDLVMRSTYDLDKDVIKQVCERGSSCVAQLSNLRDRRLAVVTCEYRNEGNSSTVVYRRWLGKVPVAQTALTAAVLGATAIVENCPHRRVDAQSSMTLGSKIYKNPL